jgi:hypothetical protein
MGKTSKAAIIMGTIYICRAKLGRGRSQNYHGLRRQMKKGS